MTLKEGPAAVLAGGRTAGSRPSPPCKVSSAEGRVEEHLNEATITRLGSILECGNMDHLGDCRTPAARSTNHDRRQLMSPNVSLLVKKGQRRWT